MGDSKPTEHGAEAVAEQPAEKRPAGPGGIAFDISGLGALLKEQPVVEQPVVDVGAVLKEQPVVDVGAVLKEQPVVEQPVVDVGAILKEQPGDIGVVGPVIDLSGIPGAVLKTPPVFDTLTDGPFVALDHRSTPHLHVTRPSGAVVPPGLRPDVPVFLPGEQVELRVEEGAWAADPRARVVPGDATLAPAGGTANPLRFAVPTTPGSYVVTAALEASNGAMGVTIPSGVAFEVVGTVGAVVTGPPALTQGSGRERVTLTVLLPAGGTLVPGSLAVAPLTGSGSGYSVTVLDSAGRPAPDRAPAPVLDVELAYPLTNPAPALVVTGQVAPLVGPAQPFRLPVAIVAVPAMPVAEQVAQGVLADLRILLLDEPGAVTGSDAVRRLVPCVPALPALGRVDGTQVLDRDITVSVPGLAGQVAHVRLSVAWSVSSPDGVLSLVGPNPRVPAPAGGQSVLSTLGLTVTPLPSTADAFDPITQPGTTPKTLTIEASVTAAVTLAGTSVTQSVNEPLPSVSIGAGLPVPTVVALYRCPDMRPDWGGITPSHGAGEGAIYLLAPSIPGNVQLPRNRILGSTTGALDTTLAALGLGPVLDGVRIDPNLAALGQLGQFLGLLNGPIPISRHLAGGLATLRGRASEATDPAVVARIDELLALSDAVSLLAASVGALIAKGGGEFGDPTSLFRTEFGRTVVNALDFTFIDHGWPAVCNVEDETESALVIGRRGTTVRLFGARNRQEGHGRANLVVDSTLTCLVPRFGDIGRGANNVAGSFPAMPPANVTRLAGASRAYGTVTTTTSLLDRGAVRFGGPGEALDATLARCVSSLDITVPR